MHRCSGCYNIFEPHAEKNKWLLFNDCPHFIGEQMDLRETNDIDILTLMDFNEIDLKNLKLPDKLCTLGLWNLPNANLKDLTLNCNLETIFLHNKPNANYADLKLNGNLESISFENSVNSSLANLKLNDKIRYIFFEGCKSPNEYVTAMLIANGYRKLQNEEKTQNIIKINCIMSGECDERWGK